MAPPPSVPIDRDWFFSQLETANRSLRDLARHMSRDPAVVSRMLNGGRRMQMHEAEQIAVFLGLPVAEVLSHAGQVSAGRDPAGDALPLSMGAIIDGQGRVTPAEGMDLPAPVHDSVRRLLRARSGLLGRPGVGLVRALDGPFAALDDATEVYDASASGGTGLAILWRGEEGQIATLLRRRADGTADVVDWTGQRAIIPGADRVSKIVGILP